MFELAGAVTASTILLAMRQTRVHTPVALVSWLAYLTAKFWDDGQNLFLPDRGRPIEVQVSVR